MALATFAVTAALVGWLLWQSGTAPEPVPDFSTLSAGEPRKTAFLGYLKPIIEAQNAQRLLTRRRLARLHADALNNRDSAWLRGLAARYGVDPDQDAADLIAALLVRVDAIPVSLALAQAAKESGWGTSRFATEGNNYFGERCWEAGCGLVPEARSQNNRFEVRSFESVEASVSSYIRNINTHPDYEAFRRYRAQLRSRDELLSGTAMAELLSPYSERREAYSKDLRNMIEHNRLDDPQ